MRCHPHPGLKALSVSAALLLAGLLLASAAGAQGAGQVDFSRYVALGDSLTAGFVSGSLIGEVQRLSYPAQLHAQATGDTAGFALPLVSRPGIPPILQLASLAPLTIAPAPGFGAPTNLFLPRPYNNLAVPGANVDDVLATRTDNGGLHDLILRGIGTQMEQALFLRPTFVTVWIGNNDVLGAATSGRVIEGVTITPLADFQTDYGIIVGALAQSGAKLALANIPEVTAIPFVTTVPPVVVNPATQQPVLIGGQPVPLIGPDGLLTPGRDFVLLTATAELAQGRGIPAALGGSGLPLSDDVVLSAAEVATISERLRAFNQVIAAAAQQTGAALVDIHGFFDGVVRDGFELGGIPYGTDFLTGGVFSYDGVHPTPLGYAVVTNRFIEAINDRFGAAIPAVDLSGFVFGPQGGAGTGLLGGSVGQVLFTHAADEQLRFSLGVPDRRTLRRIERRLARQHRRGR